MKTVQICVTPVELGELIDALDVQLDAARDEISEGLTRADAKRAQAYLNRLNRLMTKLRQATPA